MPRQPSLDSRPAPGQGLAGVDGSSEFDGWAEYRRCARRLRGRLAGRPGALHSALGDLARQEDSHRPWKPARTTESSRRRVAIARPVESANTDSMLSSVLGVASAPAERLARLVQEALGDGVLPYAARQDVLQAARRLGVGRFQANLIIAAVQHRYGTPALSLPAVTLTAASLPAVSLSDPPNPSKGPAATLEPRREGRVWRWAGTVALALALEAALVLGALSLAHL